MGSGTKHRCRAALCAEAICRNYSSDYVLGRAYLMLGVFKHLIAAVAFGLVPSL